MAEEHRCEPPEGHRPCANNCGFFGSAATMNLCSKCYGDVLLKQQQQLSIKPAAVSNFSSFVFTVTAASPAAAPAPTQPNLPEVAEMPPRANRCTVCRKRVGLTGFKCRCGITFCGTHRYPESHACSFDFKKLGREEIARANPVVKASKLNNKI